MAQSLSIHRVLSFCLVFLFFLAACGKPKTPPPQTSVQTGTEGSSSSDLESAQGSLSVSVFPHADNWAEPAVHGGWVTKNGKTTCLRCHATTQASVEGAPACGSCHILYPHSSGWIKKEVHGGSVLKNGKSACATQCHGTDLAGGLSKVSCNLCHSIYPHAADFSSPGGHGEVAKEDGKVLCIGCHGEDYQGGGSGVSCFQCHSKYPHAPNWLNPSNHGAEVVANGTVGCATQCHGSDLKGGLSGIACTMCHATFPHADGWENFSGHGQYVTTTLNGSTAECQRCHGTDLNGGGSGVSCSSCHAGYPHSANWGEAAQHGPMAYGNAKTGCATANCHGTAFEGSPQAPSCRSCHAVFPHVTPAWTTLAPGREAQRDNSFHGDQFVRLVQLGETAACTECHGTDYDRVLGSLSCKQCHAFGITHKETNGTAWPQGGGHGKFFSDHFKATDADLGCWKCHGNPVNFDATQTIENVRTSTFCYECHFSYPHTGWNYATGGATLWEPVLANNCLPKVYSGWAHTNYLFESPLFTDSQGNKPVSGTTPNADPLWGNALRFTCGSGGSCHTEGNRSYSFGGGGGPCGTSCHATGAEVAPMPTLFPCRPDPSLEIPGPPTVIGTIPASGAQNIAGDAVITIQFSEAMRESSFDAAAQMADTITLKRGADVIQRRISCDNNDWCKTVTVTPLTAFREDGSQYQVTVTTAVQDFDGIPMAANYIWSFTATNVDITPPTVAETSPRDRKTSVSLSPVFAVEFSEPMDQASVTASGTYSLRITNGAAVPIGIASCVTATDCRKTTFGLMSGRQLHRGTNYTVRVNSTVKDKAGNRLQNAYTWTFTTKN